METRLTALIKSGEIVWVKNKRNDTLSIVDSVSEGVFVSGSRLIPFDVVAGIYSGSIAEMLPLESEMNKLQNLLNGSF